MSLSRKEKTFIFGISWIALGALLVPFLGLWSILLGVGGAGIGISTIEVFYHWKKGEKEIGSEKDDSKPLLVDDLIEDEMQKEGKFDQALSQIDQLHEDARENWTSKMSEGPIDQDGLKSWIKEQLDELGFKEQFYDRWEYLNLPENDFDQALLDALDDYPRGLVLLASEMSSSGLENKSVEKLEWGVMGKHKKFPRHQSRNPSIRESVSVLDKHGLLDPPDEDDQDPEVVFSMGPDSNVGSIGTVRKSGYLTMHPHSHENHYTSYIVDKKTVVDTKDCGEILLDKGEPVSYDEEEHLLKKLGGVYRSPEFQEYINKGWVSKKYQETQPDHPEEERDGRNNLQEKLNHVVRPVAKEQK